MKRGVLWFLRLDRALYGTAIAMVFAILIGFFVRVNSLAYFAVWGLRIALLILLVFLFVMRAPTSKVMERFIEDRDREFEEREKAIFRENHRQVKLVKLRCYERGKGMKLSRVLNNRVVYGDLVLLAVVTASDGKWLVRETHSLYKGSPRSTAVYTIEDENAVCVEKTEGRDEGSCKLLIRGGDATIRVIARDDYHLNDFIAALKQSQG